MVFFQRSLPLTMTLHLLRGGWWKIVFLPYDALCNVQNGCIPGEVCGLLTVLTYPQWYTSLHVVRLFSKGTRGLPDTVPRAEVLTY